MVPKPIKSKYFNYNINIRSRLGFEKLSSSKTINSNNFRSFEKLNSKDSDIFVSNFDKEIEEDFDLIKVKSEIFTIIGHNCGDYESNEYYRSELETSENESKEIVSPVRVKNPFFKNDYFRNEDSKKEEI